MVKSISRCFLFLVFIRYNSHIRKTEVSATESNLEYIENANTLARVKHLEPLKKERYQKIKDIKEKIINMRLGKEEQARQIQVSYVFPNALSHVV